MKLTEQQRELYAAIGAGKEVRWRAKHESAQWCSYDGDHEDPPLCDDLFDWEIIDPDTITMSYTIPRPMTAKPALGSAVSWISQVDGEPCSSTWSGDALDLLRLRSFNLFQNNDAEAAHTARTAAYRKALGV